MILRCLIVISILVVSNDAFGLTMGQFSSICQSQESECSEHPMLRAYVGGALDLIAMLDEETEYMQKFYCKKPNDLFDVKTIIQFMESHRDGYREKNAMLLLIRYLEEKGGCPADDN